MRSNVECDDEFSSIGSLVSSLTVPTVYVDGKTRRISGLYLQYEAEFAKICSLCRHNKVKEAEAALNDPGWICRIDHQDAAGNTLLHIAAQNGNKRMVKLCLRHGATINMQNGSGQTPLHFALGYNYRELGEYLLLHGANEAAKNADGLTPYAQMVAWGGDGR